MSINEKQYLSKSFILFYSPKSKGDVFVQLSHYLKLLIVFCFFQFNFVGLVWGQTPKGPNIFVLNSSANTSAGVYNGDILIRTLWSNVHYDAGTYPIYWDGKDDNGIIVSPGNYIVKVLSGNVTYTWQGAHIGNSSSADTGSTVHRVYHKVIGINVIGSEVYYTAGFSERLPAVFSFAQATPQKKVNVFAAGTTTPYTEYAVTDGSNMYYSGYDPYDTTKTFIYATKIADKSKVAFSSGANYTLHEGDVYNVTGYSNNTKAQIGGLAVYKNYVFYSHPRQDSIVVINKTTGAFVRTVNIVNPRNLGYDGGGNLWVVSGTNTIAKYAINTDGTLTGTGVTITGVTTPGAITINGNNVVIIDYATQQLKWFDNITGTASNNPTFGQAGGYTTNATAANDKFCFKTLIDGNLVANVSFASDGSFWVVDPGNNRMQHFSNNRTYLESVYIPGATYFTNVDAGNTTRVFGGPIEYNINYSQTLSGSNGWTFANNWGTTLPPKYDSFQGFKFIKTITYGGVTHTYTMLKLNSGSGNELVELVANGTPRFTGRIYLSSSFIDQDNNLVQGLNRYAFTGFDGSNNPIFSSTAEVLGNLSGLTTTNDVNLTSTFSVTGGPSIFGPSSNFVTSDNKIIFYQPNPSNSNHLAAMPKGGNKLVWQTQKPTYTGYTGDFPPADYFDVGNIVNNNAGSTVMVLGQNVFTGYHGENWKAGQTNKYNHYWSDGLAIGQFGTTGYQVVGEAAYGMDGNALSPEIVQGATADVAYLYHGSESTHGGVHSWKITGLNSIQEQSITIATPDSTLTAPTAIGMDLMSGLVSATTLTRGANGWSGDGELSTSTNSFTAKIGLETYNTSIPDLSIGFSNTSVGTNSISRVLQTIPATLNSWSVTGKINFANNTPNNIGQGWSYVEILDNAGKIISRFYMSFTNGGYTEQIYGNDKMLLQDDYRVVNVLANSTQPFSISANSATLTFTYAGYSQSTSSVIDAGANLNKPTSLRFYFYSVGANRYRTFDVQQLRFYSKANQTITFGTIATKYFGNIPFALKATSNSSLPIIYTIISGPAKISGNMLTITGKGNIVVEASQPGNSLYDDAIPVMQTFIVNPLRVDL